MALFHFDSSTAEDLPSRDLLPAGWYLATIVHSDVEQPKRPEQGRVIVIGYQIDANQHPEFARRQVRTWMYPEHAGSPKTAAISRSHLKRICLTLGMDGFSDTEEFLGASLWIRVSIEKGNGQWAARNRVEDWRRLGADPLAASPEADAGSRKPEAAPAAAPTARSKPVWK